MAVRWDFRPNFAIWSGFINVRHGLIGFILENISKKKYHLESNYSQFGCLLSLLSECTGMFTSRFPLHDLVCVQQMSRIYIIYFSHHKDYTVQEWCFWKDLNNLLLSVVFCAVCSQHLTGCSYFQGVEVLWKDDCSENSFIQMSLCCKSLYLYSKAQNCFKGLNIVNNTFKTLLLKFTHDNCHLAYNLLAWNNDKKNFGSYGISSYLA